MAERFRPFLDLPPVTSKPLEPDDEGLVTVYRVEHHETGEGPYNARKASVYLWDMAAAHNNRRHPNPEADGIDSWEHQEKSYGFRSLDTLGHWFAGFLGDLDDEGFRVVTYRVPADRVVYGNRQLAFDREAAFRFATQSPLTV